MRQHFVADEYKLENTITDYIAIDKQQANMFTIPGTANKKACFADLILMQN